jgi:putative MATE family efflux protein
MSGVEEREIEVEVIGSENSARVVWELAWPAVALNSLQIVNTLLDRFFIGHLATAALTAHGGATSVMFLMFQLSVSVATGSTALVSRAYGAGDRLEFRQAARQSLRLAIVSGLVIAAVAAIVAPWTAMALLPPSDHAAIHSMRDFLWAYTLGLPGIFVVQVLAGSLRGIGDTKSPMVISGFQICLHIALNFLLILPHGRWPGLGLTGAGLALSTSALVSAVAYIVYARSTPLGRLWTAQLLPSLEWARRILRIAVPAALMACLRVLSLTAFTIVLANVAHGSEAIAAMSTAFAIESIMIMPAFGLAAAASALVGQSLGMRRPERAARLGWTAAHHGAFVTLLLASGIFFGARPIAEVLLGGKEEIIRPAVDLLHLFCFTEVGFAYAMVLIGAMQGAGDTKEPMRISIFALWVLRVPGAVLLALPAGKTLLQIGEFALRLPIGAGIGANGAWLAMASTQGLQGIMAAYLWQRGRWKTTVV